jgi:hypothetical protein
MKIEPRRAPLAEQAAQQEDTTSEIEAGPRVHRRIQVTVERETLSFLVRRPMAPSAEPPADIDSIPTQIEAGGEQK